MFEAVAPVLSLIESPEFHRFVAVGIVSFVIHYGLFLLGYWYFSLHYQIATTIGIVLAFVVNFVLNKFWTFGNASLGSMLLELSLFSFKKSVFYLLNGFLLYVLVERVHIHPVWAQLILILGLGIPSYLILKLIFSI